MHATVDRAWFLDLFSFMAWNYGWEVVFASSKRLVGSMIYYNKNETEQRIMGTRWEECPKIRKHNEACDKAYNFIAVGTSISKAKDIPICTYLNRFLYKFSLLVFLYWNEVSILKLQYLMWEKWSTWLNLIDQTASWDIKRAGVSIQNNDWT